MLKLFRILRYLPILFIPIACTLSTQEKLIPVTSSPSPPTASKTLTSPPATEPESHPSASPTPVPSTPTATLKPPPTPPPTVSPVQLNVFEELWQIINEEYLYADFNGVDWNAVHDEYRLRIEAGLSNEDFYAAMDEMVKRLGDEHSMFFNPEQAAEEDAEYAGDYDYVGIGILTVVVPERERIPLRMANASAISR
jgi:hypothetical protein